ncbi:MAG: polyribonucleotide nucleotidyltransferase [Candidatus Omnitrophota bacterium]
MQDELRSSEFKVEIGGKELIINSGKIAKQADAAVTVQSGGTIVLVTAVMSKKAKEGIDFLPLTVEYQERTYAAGKIPGGFFKREGRPSEKEILTARLIDRPIRPLFPKGLTNEIQVMAIVLSSDGENDSDILALIGASCALSVSGIPFKGPIGAIKIGRINGDFIINPSYSDLEESELELVVVGNKNDVVMIESGSKEVSREIMLEAIQFAHQSMQPMIKLQKEIVEKIGKPAREVTLKTISEELISKIKGLALENIKKIISYSCKEEREEQLELLYKDLVTKLVGEESSYTAEDVKLALVQLEEEEVRNLILNGENRFDGRKYNEIRKIYCEAGILPRTHGSGLFTRGQTQSLAVTTLGTSADEQMIDALQGESFKSFMLHYNFPPFSVGEVKPVRGPGRREIGHGALAEKALRPVMPSKEDFPYVVRVVSDILESNGSSSMATVCAGSMSLMDAGVPIKSAVSGIAMGLVKEGNKSVILTDIAGLEDHFGDMDFKVAGTPKGITAVQMDIKIEGVSLDLISQILVQADEARAIILKKMETAITAPRENISIYAPRITSMMINPEKIKDLIGPGGKTIKNIISQTGVTIDVEEDGKVLVASTDETASRQAIQMIKDLTEDVEIGKIYKGKVTRLMNFGAFVQVKGNKEGLVHVSELADHFVKNVTDEVEVGQELEVIVKEIDSQGRINLTRKGLDEKK